MCCFETEGPRAFKRTLSRLEASRDDVIATAASATRGGMGPPRQGDPNIWVTKWHAAVDGVGASEARHVPGAHKWLDSGTRLMRG